MLSVKKHNMVHKNSLALGTKREIENVKYNAHNSGFLLIMCYIAHIFDVDVGWERSEPIELV
jgi:hypothetical protein